MINDNNIYEKLDSFDSAKIIKFLRQLGKELRKMKVDGELILCGGAVMLLGFNSREITKDIDGIYSPSTEIKEITRKIAEKNSLPYDCLNDRVRYSKSFLKDLRINSEFYNRFDNLTVYKATTEQMIAMKLVAFRVGQSHDLEDLEVLIDRYGEKYPITSKSLFDIIHKHYGDLNILTKSAKKYIEEIG